MTGRFGTLRERRLAIVAGCEQDRLDVADAFRGMQRELHVADRVVAAAQRVKDHKFVVGLIAAGLVMTPVLMRKWIRRASWWLPILIQGYKIIQSSRSGRRREATS